MRQWKKIALLSFFLSMVMIGLAQISFRISIGSGDYYNPVGDYDYLPYAYPMGQGSPVRQIDFHEMMGQYGAWVMVAPFGQVWKPYAAPDWRPYMFGHWIQTRQYGPMWEGYEPWAWAGYHYGYWILDRGYGWVWIPGSDWHPGRVTWARSYDALGWMPTPPYGYDYSLGYLSRIGANNQFSYNDDDFAMDDFNYGGPYYDPRFRNMYYNPDYIRIQVLLWNFIDYGRYGDDNYADYCYGPEYTRHVFDRRLVRISNRPITRPVLERFLRRRVLESPVELRQFRSGKQAIQVVVPAGSGVAERIRRQSRAVVREIIAPGFAEKRVQFKGQNAKNRDVVARVFRQENVRPRIETLSSEQLNDRTRKARQNREEGKKVLAQSAREKLARIEKEGKFKEPRKVSIQKPQDAKKQKRKDKEAAKKQNEYYD